LLAPPADLALQEALGAAEVGQADLGGVHRVQVDQGVHQVEHDRPGVLRTDPGELLGDRKSTRLNSSHVKISYAVFCVKKKTTNVAVSIVADVQGVVNEVSVLVERFVSRLSCLSGPVEAVVAHVIIIRTIV